jgi:hypothetical protein
MTEYQFNEFPVELELSSIEDSVLRQRILISRILAASNAISAHSGRGPANYVFIHESNLLKNHIEHGHLGDIEIKSSENKDTVIIGRHDPETIHEDIHIQLKLT